MKKSRLLQRLDLAIAGAKLGLEADCYRAERALHLARLGRSDETRAIIASLHQRYDSKPNVMISAWLNLVEGLTIYFEDMGDGAYDKVLRSHALSVAASLKPLIALSAAWLAQMDYMRHKVEDMARHLSESLNLAEPNHFAARARAALVAAQALHHAGREDLASVWNKRVRDYAIAEGDDATISALMHNTAWLRMLMWRQHELTSQDGLVASRHAMMGAESTDSFDDLVGSSSLLSLQPILRAQIFSLQGEPEQAIALYKKYMIEVKDKSSARLQGCLLSDQAWCYARLAQFEAARECAIAAEQSLTNKTHIDDRATTHSRLSQVYLALGDVEASKDHELLAKNSWEQNRDLQEKVVSLIGSLHEKI